MKNIIFLIIFLIHIQSCDKPINPRYALMVANNSEDSVCAFLADKRSLTQYPDTVLPIDRPALQIITSGSKSYHDSREPWSKELDYLPADTLSVFIIDAQLYRDSSWSYIRDNYQILRRYDLSLENLESLNFNVPYPPTAEMAGMKMYPQIVKYEYQGARSILYIVIMGMGTTTVENKIPQNLVNEQNIGVSLGYFPNVWIRDEIGDDFRNRVLVDPLFMHEYGHIRDSRIFGFGYLFGIGIPSILGAEWTERKANRHAARYFEKYYGVDWAPFERVYPRR